MAILGTVLLALLALMWVVQGLRVAVGMRRLPRLRDSQPLADADCPSVSILFSARDEEEKLPQALATMLALDYPRYEVVAVNDRSSDATGRILDEAAARDPRLKVVHVSELPPGWLGKPHGLQRAYDASSGKWLIFTDADVRFAPDLLRRSLALAKTQQWDHLTLLGQVDMHGFWETSLLTFFMLGMVMYVEAWRVSDPRSGRYLGVGSFQLFRRAAYEACGTHRKLKMEAVDDVKLGKLAKLGGFRSGVGIPGKAVAVRWHDGLGNIIRGVEKNFFAGAKYRLSNAIGQVAAISALELLPYCVLSFVSGLNFALALVPIVIASAMQGAAARESGASPLYGLTFPLAAVIFSYMVMRSTILTLRRGGIIWRGTFYRLDDLRNGIV